VIVNLARTKQLWIQALAIVLCSVVSLAGNTSLFAPPRSDGAGYAMLAKSLVTGKGYRDIALPQPTRHTHFPPGYPIALAALWWITGWSLPAAHLLSCACTIAASLLAWLWFRCLYSSRVAFTLGLVLAVNWTWGRYGGAILSEPMFLLLGQFALLLAVRASRRGSVGSGAILGTLLAACILTRHVGVALAAAIGIHLFLCWRWLTGVAAGLICGALLLPWVGWLALVGTQNQASLLPLNEESFGNRISALAVFYAQRLSDQLLGPFVEIGTVFQHRAWVTTVANIWASAATSVLIIGLVLSLRLRRRRLAGLTVFATLAILLVWPFTEAGRFLIPLVPCLLVGTVDGLASLAVKLKFRQSRIWIASAVLAVSLLYAIYAIVFARAKVQRQSYRSFDAACAWIVQETTRTGPILARHPGEVFWLTGRQSLSILSDEPEFIDRLIDRFDVAYLLIDEDRYARSQVSPLSQYVAQRPHQVRKVWKSGSGAASVVIYECNKSPGNRN
jgi:hypothetical protein